MSRLITLNWQIYEMLTADSVPVLSKSKLGQNSPSGREPTLCLAIQK